MITISVIENRRISGTHWICIWARRANQIFTNFWTLTNPILWKMFFNSIFIIKYQTSSKIWIFKTKQVNVKYLLVTSSWCFLSPTSADGDVAYGNKLGALFVINFEIGYLCRIVGVLKIEYDLEIDIFSDFQKNLVTLSQCEHFMGDDTAPNQVTQCYLLQWGQRGAV